MVKKNQDINNKKIQNELGKKNQSKGYFSLLDEATAQTPATPIF